MFIHFLFGNTLILFGNSLKFNVIMFTYRNLAQTVLGACPEEYIRIFLWITCAILDVYFRVVQKSLEVFIYARVRLFSD